MDEFDFVAIGDITTDAFIELKDASVNCSTDDCMLCMRWGDKIPFNKATVVKGVGNSANAAVSASRLDLQSALVSNVGNDENGEDCIETMRSEGVNVKYIDIESGKKTNYHYVLSLEAERTILVKHEDFQYEVPKIKTNWIYFSSIGENAIDFHDEVAKFVNDNNTKLAFQPGTFQINLGAKRLKKVYQNTEVFFCNKQEAQRILSKETEEIKELLKGISSLGPKITVITDGPDGAYTYDGKEFLYIPAYPDPKPPLERTGAGDAFSSAFVSFLAQGMTIEEALTRAPINSMSVVQYIGAREGLLTMKKIEEYLRDAPENYRVERI